MESACHHREAKVSARAHWTSSPPAWCPGSRLDSELEPGRDSVLPSLASWSWGVNYEGAIVICNSRANRFPLKGEHPTWLLTCHHEGAVEQLHRRSSEEAGRILAVLGLSEVLSRPEIQDTLHIGKRLFLELGGGYQADPGTFSTPDTYSGLKAEANGASSPQTTRLSK